MHRHPSSAASWWRHIAWSSGNPCTNTNGGPSPRTWTASVAPAPVTRTMPVTERTIRYLCHMRVPTDYIRHSARAARKCAGDTLGGAPQPPDPEFYKTLAKALEEIAADLEQLGKGEE